MPALTKHEAHLEKESEKPCFKDASTRDASHDETTPVDKAMKEDDEPSKSELFENKEDTESTILVEEPILGKHLESLNAIHDDIKACDLVQDSETKSSIKEKLQTATPQEIWGDKIDQTSFDTKEETPEDISTNVLNEETEQNSIVEVPFFTEALTTDNELAITAGKIKDEDKRGKDLLENNNDTESELLKQEVTEKPVEPLQLANEEEDTKVSISDNDTTLSVLENQSLTENPQEIVAGETESKPCDVVDTKKETLDGQDVSTIESNDDNEKNLVIEEDESEKPLLSEESIRDAVGDESIYTNEDKKEVADQRRAELFENENSAESLSLIEDNTTPKLVKSPQIDAEDIKTHVLDQDAETTSLSNDGESAVKYEVKTEDDDQKEDQLCDSEKNPESNVLLEAGQLETPIASMQETLPSTVPQDFVGDETEEKTVDGIHTDKEILDVQNVTKTVSNEKIEEHSLIQMDGSPIQHEESLEKEHERPSLIESTDHDSLLQVDGSQIQCKDYSEEKSEITSIIEASTKNINDDNPVNVHEGSNDHEDLRKDEFGDTEITSQEEEAQVETPANSTNIAAEDIIASDLCQETETTSSQEERTLNVEETVCEQREVETLDTSDTKTQTLETRDVSTSVPNDDSRENSATEENDLQIKNEETFGKETEKPSVNETSTTDASDDDSANKFEDKVEGEEQTGAELFEDKKDTESKMLKEKEIMVRLVESPQVDNEAIKTYVSDEGAETTGMVEASEGYADNHESAVKNEVKTEDNDKKEDELSENEKNTESGELLEAAQTERSIESLQETLPSTVPRGFLDDNTEEKTVDALQKDEDVQNVTTTVPNEKIEENSLIQMDDSQIQHEEYLEKEREIPSVIETSTKHANYDELIAREVNIEHEDPRKVEPEIEKYTEINSQEDDAQIETHIAEDIIASDSYQATETTDSQEEQILNETEIVHEETQVERLDAADTKKETPEAPDVSTFVLNDDNEENLVIEEDDSEMKNEDNLGKESQNPPSIEASLMDTSSYESTKKFEDKGKEQTRAEDTECSLLKEAETAAQPLKYPQVDAEDTKTYVSDQGTETTGLVEVFEEVANDSRPEVKCMIKTEDKDQKEDELCDNEKIPDGTLHLKVAEMEKPFESLKEALPTSIPRGFLDEKTEEKIIDATEKDEETLEIQQNVTTIVSNENIEHDSLIQVDGSQMQCKECPEGESERTPIIEASTKNINDDDSINVHEDSTEHEDQRKDELVETKEDTKITSQKEEAQVETAVKSLKIAAEDIIESDSRQETETMNSQEEQILNDEEIVCEQIEVETLDTADKKTETPEAQDVSTIVPNDDIKANSATGKNDSQMKNKENLGKESEKTSVIEAWTMDASGDESTNKREDKVEGEEQAGAEMFVDKRDTESTLLKEEEIMVKLVEFPHVDTENIKTYVSDEGAEKTGVVEAFEGNADVDKSAIKYEVKTEDTDQKDNEKNPESGALLEEAQIEKPTDSLKETLTSTVPREFLDDKTEEKTKDAIEKDKEILEVQSVAKTVSNEKIEDNSLIQAESSQIQKIEDNSLIQAESSQIQHEEYLEKEIEIPSVIEALTKHADDDELTSIHEDNIEHKDLRKVELLESNRDTEINLQKEEAQMGTSDLYHGTETTSQQEQFLNENEIIHERTEVERLDTADSDKEIPEAQNFATILSSENIKENSGIPEDGSEQKHEELLEKESKAQPFSETSTMEVNDEVPEVIHQDKIEDEKLEKVDKFECDKHEEITLLNETPAEKLQESSKEDLEDIKDIVSGANTIERSLIEVQSPNENIREIVGDHMDENIVDKDPEVREIEDEHLDKDAMFKNEKHTEIGFIKEEESMKKLQKPEKKDLEEIKAFVSHEGTETTSSIEERDLTAISQESVGDLSEDKILDKAQEISDSTIVSGEHAEKYSSIHPDGSQMKHEELSEKECEMLSTPETSFLYSSNDEPMTIDVENIENKHLNKVDKFEDEKHTKIAIINDQAPVEGPQESSRRNIEEVKAFVSCEGAETSSTEEQGLTEISPEIMGDKSEKKILDKVGMTQEFDIVPDENGREISLMLVDESQIKHQELLEKESQASPLSETSLRNSNFNESTILHQDKIEDEILNRVDKFESEKHAEISLIKEEALVEKLNESSLRKDLEEIKAFDLSEDMETSSTGERNLTAIPQENDFKQTVSHEHAGENLLIQVDESEVKHEIASDQTQENVFDTAPKDQDLKPAISHENAEENSLVQVDEIRMKHDELEKESEKPSLLIVDTSNKESKTIYEDITEDEYRKKIHDFECEKHEVITSTEEETQVTKVNESSKEDLEDVKALVSGEDSETTSFEEKQSLKENPREILSEQQEVKILDIAHEPQNFIKVVSNENVEKDSMIQEDGSPMVHGEISEKEGETPSLSAAFILNTTSEDSTVIHENKIEDEDTREVDIFECEKQVDGKVLDAAREARESKIIVLDEKTEEKSSNQVDKSQTKHEELLEKESKTLSLSKTSLLNISNEDSTTINDDKIEDEDPEKVELECEKHTEFPLTKEERGQILNNPLKEDIEEKEFVSCLDTETRSSTEDRSLQINPQEVMGDQMEENIIDTTPEPQNFTTLVSDKNTKKNLLLEEDESQIKHELLENESEKPSLWILNTSNEEPSFICHSKTEKEGVKRHEKVEQLTDFPEEGPEIIEVPVPSENLEKPSPVEERNLTENPQENLTKDEILDVVPEALQESKTIVSDKNIEENSFILENGSQMKHEEHSEKESEKPSVSENSIVNTRNEEPTLFLDDKIEEEDQAKGNKSECEKHAEITEVPAENPNSSNLENIEAFVSCEDIKPIISTEEQSLKVNPIEIVEGQEVEKVLDKALEAPDLSPVVPDDNNGDNPSIQVDGSQMKLEEPLEKESEMPSLLGTSMMNANNEETENIDKKLIEDEALENVDKFESKKCSEINKLKEEAQVEESTVYKDIKAYVLYQDTEPSALEEQILDANPQDILGNQSEGNVIDPADSKEKITEQNLPVSNENVVKDSLIQIDESKTKHEEILETEPYLEKTSTVEANNESTTSHEDMIEEERWENYGECAVK
ncbi:uncharacterized protein LOC142505496 isoform X7 [Primulina tabacum]|uniref:uncharacterized protein LOC142505496 isoform X7 n=1 Tax=Primulina tabacum TaxID=48773 RepID=UPI003F59E9E9